MYTSSSRVALLLGPLIQFKADFDTVTLPTKAMVDAYINWVDAHIDSQFRQAGYKLPLTYISGEEWPTTQTYYLELLSTLGAASFAGGISLKPAPAVGPSNSTGNMFRDLYNEEMQRIWDGTRTQIRFRADYYSGTPAETALFLPQGPISDFMEGRYDPMRWELFEEISERMYTIQTRMRDLGIKWDYLNGYQDYTGFSSRDVDSLLWL